MKIAIMQPTYLPWIGYFDLMERVDHFVFLDTVQFSKQSWQQRNRIKTHQGELILTVPVQQKIGQIIGEVRIDNRSPWARKHWKSIKLAYEKAPFWNEISKDLAPVYERKHELLNGLNLSLIEKIKVLLGITTKTSQSSEIIHVEVDRTERLIQIIRDLGGTDYLSPIGAKDYIEEDLQLFEKNGIRVEFQNYEHPRYPQLHGEFVSHLSAIDYLFNLGPKPTGSLK